MKKVLFLACVLLLVFCAPKQSSVQTEGLEEVIVFGDEGEEVYVDDTPILPEPVEEEPVVPPLPEEEEVIAPPPPVVEEEEPVAPPPVVEPEEEVVVPPPPMPIEEEPVEEEVVVPPPPPPIVEEEEIVTPAPVIEEEPYMPPVITETPPPPTPPTPPPSQILGFRVQIFASSTEGNANRIAGDARPSFDETIYVEHIAPYYKVRVGDFLTRGEADMVKNKAQQIGFRGAFVVETMISP